MTDNQNNEPFNQTEQKTLESPAENIESAELITETITAIAEIDEGCEVAGPYIMKAGQFIKLADNKGEKKLTNLTARIKADLVVDRSGTIERHHEIEAQIGDKVVSFKIKSTDFDNLRWVHRELGSGAIIEPGAKQHIPNAIRRFSGDIPQKHVADHTGWLDVAGHDVYVHAGGFIGDPPCGVVSDLPPQLSRYHLPPLPTKSKLKKAVQTSLNFMELGSHQITVPVLAAIYRSVLGPIDMSLHLVGESGTYKSTLAGLALGHFGPGFDRTTLPASWSGTALSLQTVSHHAKDALLVLDDYVPKEDNAETKAATLFRSQGNGNGRSRLVGGSLSQANRDPRSLILSTGEAVPSGSSIRARLVIVPVDVEPLDLKYLADAAKISKQGKYAQAMTGYITWLVEHYAELQATRSDSVDEQRQFFESAGQHARASTNSAQLAVGMDWFLRFAEDRACLDSFEVRHVKEMVQNTLVSLTKIQSQYQLGSANDIDKFMKLLRLVFDRQQAHLLPSESNYISNPHLWGWKPSPGCSHKPCGPQIGWTGGRDALNKSTDDHIYLLPDLAYQACQKASPVAESQLTIRPRPLWKLLHDAGLLVDTEMQSRNSRPIRKQFAGKRYDVLHLRKDSIYEVEAE